MINTNYQQGHKSYVYLVSLVASVGGFLFGFDVALICTALPFLEMHFQLTAGLKGLAVSSIDLGCSAGPLIGLWFADNFGRKKTMLIAALCFLLSALGCAFAFTIWDFVVFRFIGGLGVGLAMTTSPIYIAEISPPAKRGGLVNINQLMGVIGTNIAIVTGYLFALFMTNEWRWMFGSEMVLIVLLIIGLLFIPESPRWLAGKARENEALKVLTNINGREIADKELNYINEELKTETGKFSELLRPGIKTALFIGIILMVFSQINGVNMMLLYGPTIMADAGIEVGSESILSSMPVYAFILICTIISFSLIKRFSRRGLLMVSVFFMMVGHIIMTINLTQQWTPILTLIPLLIATGAFTLGFAPLSWIITSEIFPNRIRGKAMAIVVSILFLSNFILAQMFPSLSQWFNDRYSNTGGMYLIFAAICGACLVFSWKYVPETKGLSLEEISKFWLNNNGSWVKSSSKAPK